VCSSDLIKELSYNTKNCTQTLNVEVEDGELGEEHFGSIESTINCGGIFLGDCLYGSNSYTLFLRLPTNLSVGDKLLLNNDWSYSGGTIVTVTDINYDCSICTSTTCIACYGNSRFTVSGVDLHSAAYWTYRRQTSQPAPVITTTWEETCS
jgi:hypothetical protein